MRCPECNYSLWGVRDRACPECGREFRVSDYEFHPSTVEFCCPKCKHAYVGEGAHGYLSPRFFTCVTCNEPVDMADMVLRPAAGVGEDEAVLHRMPWLDRDIPPIRRWIRTSLAGLFRPAGLMRRMPARTATGPAAAYFVITSLILTILQPLFLTILFLFQGGLEGLFVSVTMWVMYAVMWTGSLVALLVWIAAAHVLLVFTGKTTSTMSRTADAFCYSCPALILGSVPLVGLFLICIAPLWWTINAARMLRVRQNVPLWRATLAVGLPTLLCYAAPGILMALLVIGVQRSVSQAMASYAPPPPASWSISP